MLGAYAQGGDYVAQVRSLIHDPSASDLTDAQILTLVNNARLRTAQDLRVCRQFISGLNTISQQETYPLNGWVGGVIVTNGGANYANGTTAVFTGGGGSGAAATVIVSGGVVMGINMTNWGGGYTSTPSLALANVGSGSGATFQVVAGLMIHDILTMTVLWNGAPAPQSSLAVTFDWLPFMAFQAFCRAYRGTFSNPGAYTVHYGTTSPTMQTADARAFYIYPIPNQAYTLEMDVSILPSPLQALTDVDYQIVTPWNDAVQYFAAHLAFLGLQQFAQAGSLKGIYESRCRELPATGYVRRVHNAYRSFWPLIRRM